MAPAATRAQGPQRPQLIERACERLPQRKRAASAAPPAALVQDKYRRSLSSERGGDGGDGRLSPQALSFSRPQLLLGASRAASGRSGISGIGEIERLAGGMHRTSVDRVAVLQNLEQLRSLRAQAGRDADLSAEDIQSVIRAVQVRCDRCMPAWRARLA